MSHTQTGLMAQKGALFVALGRSLIWLNEDIFLRMWRSKWADHLCYSPKLASIKLFEVSFGSSLLHHLLESVAYLVTILTPSYLFYFGCPSSSLGHHRLFSGPTIAKPSSWFLHSELSSSSSTRSPVDKARFPIVTALMVSLSELLMEPQFLLTWSPWHKI